MVAGTTNYYDILGVSKNAGDKEIRRAYRKLARRYHPDLNPGDKQAEDLFKGINEAYEVLSDADSRKKYDRYGENWRHADQIEAGFGKGAGAPFQWTYRGGRGSTQASGPIGGFEDLRGNLGGQFGHGGRTTTATRVEASVEVSLDESFAGATRNLVLTADGKKRRFEVSIPPGVDTGSVVRISPGEGQELFLKVIVLPHPEFSRDGSDLTTEVKVPLVDAILGGEVPVQTLGKKVQLKVPPESQNGQRIRLGGQGMPNLGASETRGDLYVVIRPVIPSGLSEEERELFVRLKRLLSTVG